MMLIIIMLIPFIGCLVFDLIRENRGYHDPIGSIAFGVVLFITLLILPITRYSYHIDIEEFNSRKATITEQRATSTNPYEQALLIQEIIDDNAWLAIQQANKKRNFVNWYIPKEIQDLTPIR